MKNIFQFIRCGGFLSVRSILRKGCFAVVVFCLFNTTNPLHAQWVQTNGPGGGFVSCFAISGTNLFAGTRGGGVFLSTNNGTNWTQVNNGLTNTDVRSLAVSPATGGSGTNLFAGTDGGGVWRRPLSEMITSVQFTSNQLPSEFQLEQNYPNPFNPTTTIKFSLPSKSFVSLIVFDALGREVATLVNGELSARNHYYQWNSVNIPSGVYFYRLQAGSFSETKKLMLLR